MMEIVEWCPSCECENLFENWNVKKQGYMATCWNCGKQLLLCDVCLRSDDNPNGRCDWREVRTEKKECLAAGCFRGIHCEKRSQDAIRRSHIHFNIGVNENSSQGI